MEIGSGLSVDQERALLQLVETALNQDAAARDDWLKANCPSELLARAQGILADALDIDESDHDTGTMLQTGVRDSSATSVPSYDRSTIAAAAPGDANATAVNEQVASTPKPDSAALAARASEVGVVEVNVDTNLTPGTVIKGRFVIEGTIGHGGMGVVYRARDLRKEETQDRDPYVALKVLNREFRTNPMMVIALQREARKAQSLAHPNIATVFDFDRDGDIVFLTMELLEGQPLNEYIKEHPDGVPWDEISGVVRGLCLGLAYAHNKRIVHSDFKPGNVFITGNGGAKILDFGIARAAPSLDAGDQDAQTKFDAKVLGALTPSYASLEMIDGASPHPSDDVYALAIVIYQLLTGKHPFRFLNAAEAKQNGLVAKPLRSVNRRQRRAIAHGLAFDRADRSADAAAFLQEVEGSPKTRMALAAVATAFALSSAYAAYQEVQVAAAARPEVPFEQLTAKIRGEFHTKMQDAQKFAGYKDYTAAVASYKDAYGLHPRNPQVVKEIEELFDSLYAAVGRSEDSFEREALRASLARVRAIDDFLGSNGKLETIAEKIQ